MRITGFLLFALIFAVTPFFLLNAVVMPQLSQVQQIYSHADEIAAQVAQP